MQMLNIDFHGASGSVAVIAISHPPVNSLGHPVRAALAEAVQSVFAMDSVSAMVIKGAGKMFSAGADMLEFDTPKVAQPPDLGEVITLIETGPKPVVAAIHGVAMGGGFELALGCHGRVATRSALLALPEIKLGLMPGSGGTQRLPRLAGLARAMETILSGETQTAETWLGTDLLDQVVDDEQALLDAAIALAQDMARTHRWQPTRDRVVPDAQAAALLAAARAKAARSFPSLLAPPRCLDALEASVQQPFPDGLKLEWSHFLDLSATSQARALRHLFFAEKAASSIADLPKGSQGRAIHTAAVVGAGTMGTGIAQCLMGAGIPVRLMDRDQASLDRGVGKITAQFERARDKGRLTPQQMETALGLLMPVADYAALGDVDIVIEAVFERLDVKMAVFQALDAAMKPGAILATNTSMLDINQLAASIGRPQDVVGMHFFSPAHVMRLLEVVRGEQTSADVLATVMRLARRIGKTAVVARVCDGFIGNRMIEQYLRQAGFMLEEGATPSQVDGAIERFGFAMGPFRMSDMAGNDVGYDIRQRRRRETPALFYSRIPDLLIEQLGRTGQKTRRGWYDYADGSHQALRSTEVEDMVMAYRTQHGLKPREIQDEEIVKRLIYALVNEGFHILDEGIAQRSSDIDVAYVTGYGFPNVRGGPMFHAQEAGLPSVLADMETFARNSQADPAFWKPAHGLQQAARGAQAERG